MSMKSKKDLLVKVMMKINLGACVMKTKLMERMMKKLMKDER